MNIIEHESILSELSSVDVILKSIPENDIFGRLSFESKKKRLESELSKLQQNIGKHAEVVLYFGGKPVRGSDSIIASFASKAVASFQELVSALFASQKIEISESGVIPFKSESQLAIAGTPRGSFGFILKENSIQSSLIDTKMFDVVSQVVDLLEFSSNGDTDALVSNLNPRVKQYLYDFVDILATNDASLRVQTHSKKISITAPKAKEALAEIKNITIITQKRQYCGIFRGATQDSRHFDFVRNDDEHCLISGKISSDIEDKFIFRMNTEYMDKQCIGVIERKDTSRKGSEKITTSWKLFDLLPSSTVEDDIG